MAENRKTAAKYKTKENRAGSTPGAGERCICENNGMRLEKLHAETIDTEGRDMEEILASIAWEWAKACSMGDGFFPLLGVLTLDKKKGLVLDLIAPSFVDNSSLEDPKQEDTYNADSAEDSAAADKTDGEEAEPGTSESEGGKPETCAAGYPGNGLPEEESGNESGRSIIRDMLADIDSMKGMIYGASQMLSLAGNGVLTNDQAAYTLQLYCKSAKEIAAKWNEFWKNDI